MRTALRAGLSLALAASTLWFAKPAVAECSESWGDTEGSTCPGNLSWAYNTAKRQFEYGNKLVPNEQEDKFLYDVKYACTGNDVGETEIECKTARDCEPLTDADGTTLFGRKVLVMKRPKNGSGNWSPAGAGCRYAGKTVPMNDVVAAVERRLEKEVGRPTITAQPPNRVTLVNFVSIFSAPAQQVTSLSIDAPVPGTLTGAPEYSWDLGDGIKQTGAGHLYDSGKDPSDPGTDGYYVKAKYESKGRKHITLTLTWRVTMTLGGAGTVELDPIVFTANDYTEAREKRAVLVNN